jgi:hypothetical protein
MENLKVVEDMNGQTAKYIRDNGKMELNMDLVFGEVLKEILTLDNGKKERLMDMEFTHGTMEIDMKDNLKIV